jgi:hypothetical protein
MKERLNKLLAVKSIVTIIATIVFAILALKGEINSEQVLMIYTTIIAFYFGTQAKKDGTDVK